MIKFDGKVLYSLLLFILSVFLHGSSGRVEDRKFYSNIYIRDDFWPLIFDRNSSNSFLKAMT